MINQNNKKAKIIIIGAGVISALILLFIKTRTNYAIPTSIKEENKYEILVDVEESKLYLINNGKIEQIYSCSGGKWSTPSPIGTWKIIQKAKWGEGFRWTLDGIKCALGTIWNTWHVRSIFCWVGKFTWMHKNE